MLRYGTTLQLGYMKSFGHLFPFHCHGTHFTARVIFWAPMPAPGFRFPGEGGQTVLGSRRDNIPTKAKNISLQSFRERKRYLSKSRMLMNVLSFLHARSKLLQHTSAACEGTGQASKLSPTLRKHARLYTLPKKAAGVPHKASRNKKKKKTKPKNPTKKPKTNQQQTTHHQNKTKKTLTQKLKPQQSALILTTREYNWTKYQIKASHKIGVRAVK